MLEVELGLDPGQMGFLDPAHYALALLDLGRQQRIEILHVALPDRRLGQRLELPGNRRHLQSTAMLPCS